MPVNHSIKGGRDHIALGFPILWIISLVLLLTNPVASQSQGTPVYVTASFVDKNGFFIENLSPEEIQILEDDQPRKLELLAKDEMPAAYSLLFDKALLPESMDLGRTIPGNLTSAASAKSLAYGLIDKLAGRQVLWVGTFDKDLQVISDFSPDAYSAKDAIQRIQGSRRPQEPFLYGAILSAIQKLQLRQERRKALILFIDAVDVETGGKIRPLKNLIASSNVELFAVSFASRLGTGPGRLPSSSSEAILRDLTNATAGDLYLTSQYRDHLEDLVRRINNHIRTFYSLGFHSTSLPAKSSRLTIKCTRAGSKAKYRPTAPIAG